MIEDIYIGIDNFNGIIHNIIARKLSSVRSTLSPQTLSPYPQIRL